MCSSTAMRLAEMLKQNKDTHAPCSLVREMSRYESKQGKIIKLYQAETNLPVGFKREVDVFCGTHKNSLLAVRT